MPDICTDSHVLVYANLRRDSANSIQKKQKRKRGQKTQLKRKEKFTGDHGNGDNPAEPDIIRTLSPHAMIYTRLVECF